MLLNADECQLILIDYQARLMPAINGGQAVLDNALRLARIARELGVPVWGTEQMPERLGENDGALKALCDGTVQKTSFSAAEVLLPLLFPKPKAPAGNARSLPRHLQKTAQTPARTRETLILAGCEAHVCLLQTALALGNEHEVWVVTDACGSRTERNRDAAFDRLASTGVELVTTEMVGFEWLADARHPAFKAWQGMIR